MMEEVKEGSQGVCFGHRSDMQGMSWSALEHDLHCKGLGRHRGAGRDPLFSLGCDR
jgi:hypothetical protein